MRTKEENTSVPADLPTADTAGIEPIGFWERFKSILSGPVDGASLALFRIAVGVIMTLEAITLLRPSLSSGGAAPLENYYTGPNIGFNFPYPGFEWLPLLPPSLMLAVVWILAIAGLTMALGLFYRTSAVLVFLAWAYLYAVECTRTYWMSHYYLVLLTTFLLIWMPAARRVQHRLPARGWAAGEDTLLAGVPVAGPIVDHLFLRGCRQAQRGLAPRCPTGPLLLVPTPRSNPVRIDQSTPAYSRIRLFHQLRGGLVRSFGWFSADFSADPDCRFHPDVPLPRHQPFPAVSRHRLVPIVGCGLRHHLSLPGLAGTTPGLAPAFAPITDHLGPRTSIAAHGQDRRSLCRGLVDVAGLVSAAALPHSGRCSVHLRRPGL